MSPTCSICRHADRAAIEEQHVQGLSLRAIAKLHPGTTPWSLARHFKHLPAIIEKAGAHQLAQDLGSVKLPARVEKLISEAESITMTARRKHNFSAALAAIRTRLQCLEMLGKLSGELRPGGPPVGEFIPGVATAAAQASVTVNMPAPAREKTWSDLNKLLREIYGLGPVREPKITPVM